MLASHGKDAVPSPTNRYCPAHVETLECCLDELLDAGYRIVGPDEEQS